jgi:hypothetical protein
MAQRPKEVIVHSICSRRQQPGKILDSGAEESTVEDCGIDENKVKSEINEPYVGPESFILVQEPKDKMRSSPLVQGVRLDMAEKAHEERASVSEGGSIKKPSSGGNWVEVKKLSSMEHMSREDLGWEIIGEDELTANGWENGDSNGKCIAHRL